MKFAFSSNAFRKYSLSEAAIAISDAGYMGIEIMCDRPHAYPEDLSDSDIKSIKSNLDKKGLTISNLNAFMLCAIGDFHHPSWIEQDKEYRELRIQYTLDCIDMAEKFGVKTISTEPGGPVNGVSREIALEMFMEGLSRVVPYASEKGVKILIEPEPDLLIQNSEEFISFMNEFTYPEIGLNFDIGHFFCAGEDPAEKILELKEHIFHFHLEDIPETREHKHILPGDGSIDIPGVLKAIETIGYKGFVTVELYPYLDSAPETAQKAIKYLNGLLDHG